MAKPVDQKPKTDKLPHPFITVLGVFGSAYIKELRARQTFGYKLKGELANTAAAAAAGVQALRDYDPQAKLRQRQQEARQHSSSINGQL